MSNRPGITYATQVRYLANRLGVSQAVVRELLRLYWDRVLVHLSTGQSVRLPRAFGTLHMQVSPTRSPAQVGQRGRGTVPTYALRIRLQPPRRMRRRLRQLWERAHAENRGDS